jgi:hypothetical protein
LIQVKSPRYQRRIFAQPLGGTLKPKNGADQAKYGNKLTGRYESIAGAASLADAPKSLVFHAINRRPRHAPTLFDAKVIPTARADGFKK